MFEGLVKLSQAGRNCQGPLSTATDARARWQVRSLDDTLTCARHMHTDSLAPIFLTSSVTGDGLDLIRLFYNLLPQRIKW